MKLDLHPWYGKVSAEELKRIKQGEVEALSEMLTQALPPDGSLLTHRPCRRKHIDNPPARKISVAS